MVGNKKTQNPNIDDYQPSAKRPTLTCNINEASVDESTKITDLNYDCLEKIFDYMDFNTFFNMALSNKSLQRSAVLAFKRKFGNNEFRLLPATALDLRPIKIISISIVGLKNCLQFVRCFGETITDLIIEKALNKKANYRLKQYIQQYCSNTLTKIYFGQNAIDHDSFQQPFNKVDFIEVCDYSNLICCAHWFPNIRSLSVAAPMRNFYEHNETDYLRIKEDPDYLTINFPQLQHIKLDLTIPIGMTRRLDRLLGANQQLQSIVLLNGSLRVWEALDLIDRNRNILKLDICPVYWVPEIGEVRDVKRLVLEHPFLIDLKLSYYQFEAAAILFLIRNLKSLKKLRILANSQTDWNTVVTQLGKEWHHNDPPFWCWSEDAIYIELIR